MNQRLSIIIFIILLAFGGILISMAALTGNYRIYGIINGVIVGLSYCLGQSTKK